MFRRSVTQCIAMGVFLVCLFGMTGCWQRQAAQARAAQALAIAERDAARAAQAAADQAAMAAARVQGTAAAQKDTANDVLKLKEYPPLPSPAWQKKYVDLLKERCNVGYEVVQGPPEMSEPLREEVAAYNEAMTAEIERRFEVGILAKLQNEAQGK